MISGKEANLLGPEWVGRRETLGSFFPGVFSAKGPGFDRTMAFEVARAVFVGV
jgi:hypothetical protein